MSAISWFHRRRCIQLRMTGLRDDATISGAASSGQTGADVAKERIQMSKPVVCVVGAGTAGLEGLLTVHEQLGDSVDLRVIAPEREFRYRPMSAGSLFRPTEEREALIGDISAEVGANYLCEPVVAVYEDDRCVVTRDGDTVSFDYLLLAPGARDARSLQQGFVWERGQDPGFLDQVRDSIRTAPGGRVAVIVPRGARWSVPAYELALVLAWASASTGTEVSLITAEARLLGMLGRDATSLITRELQDAGVVAVTGVEVVDAPHSELRSSGPIDVILVPESTTSEEDALTGKPTESHHGASEAQSFDFVIALPTVRGPAIPGVRSDTAGFVEVDTGLKVGGSERVWAAGGCIAAALEHSALSALQGDVAAAAITRAVNPSCGDAHLEIPTPLLVTGILLSGQRDRWLAENPAGTRQPSTRCLWWPPGRAVGHMLAGRIAAWDPSVQGTLPDLADGVPICVPVVLGHEDRGSRAGNIVADEATHKARSRDLENRQMMAVERREHEAADELRKLGRGLERLAADQRHVEDGLRAHGYLRDREAV
jgi:sulfide:quinone oxidoreductase